MRLLSKYTAAFQSFVNSKISRERELHDRYIFENSVEKGLSPKCPRNDVSV